MNTLVWLPTAHRQKMSAIRFLAQQDPFRASKQLEAIDLQVRQLTDQPHLGRPGRKAGTRALVIRKTPYVAVYRVMRSGEVRITRLVHGLRDW